MKNAVIYGGSGALGRAIGAALVRDGFAVYVAGRTQAKLDSAAAAIGAAGTAVVDVLDEAAVAAHLASVGDVDVCVNAVGIDVGEQGVPLAELTADAFMEPVSAYVRGNFVTARQAALNMPNGGVVMALTPPMSRAPTALAGPFGVSGAAIENLYRQLAAELGPAGVRVVCLRLAGIPETAMHLGSHTARMWGRAADRLGVTLDALLEGVGGGTARGRPLTVAEVADVAAFAASERSAGMTGTVLNVTGGAVVD